MVETGYDGDVWTAYDFAPEEGSGITIPLPVRFTSTIPAPAQHAKPAAAGCRVPTVKGKSPQSAVHLLGGKGCAYSLRLTHAYSSVRKGRVVRTIPAAGTKTKAKVKLIISRGRHHH